jgi:hypothetical protein
MTIGKVKICQYVCKFILMEYNNKDDNVNNDLRVMKIYNSYGN